MFIKNIAIKRTKSPVFKNTKKSFLVTSGLPFFIIQSPNNAGPIRVIATSFTLKASPNKTPARSGFGFDCLKSVARAKNPNARYIPFKRMRRVSMSKALSSVIKKAAMNGENLSEVILRTKQKTAIASKVPKNACIKRSAA